MTQKHADLKFDGCDCHYLGRDESENRKGEGDEGYAKSKEIEYNTEGDSRLERGGETGVAIAGSALRSEHYGVRAHSGESVFCHWSVAGCFSGFSPGQMGETLPRLGSVDELREMFEAGLLPFGVEDWM